MNIPIKRPESPPLPPRDLAGSPRATDPADEARAFLNRCEVKPFSILTPTPGIDGLRALAKRRDWVRLISYEETWSNSPFKFLQDDIRIRLEFKVIYILHSILNSLSLSRLKKGSSMLH